MSQHDYDIANQSFPAFRTDLNNVLGAINSSNSGTSRPSGAVEGTIWLDTTSATTPTLKFYDGADDISLATIDYSANTVNWLDSTVVFDIVGDTTPQLGGNLDVNGNSIVSVSNGNITFTPDGTGKVIIDGLSHPTADGTADQVLKTDGAGNLSFADAGGGKILQVVTAEYSTQTDSTSATFADTGLTANITPSSTSNKILVIANHTNIRKNGSTQIGFKLFRDATEIRQSLSLGDTNDASRIHFSVTIVELDSPSSSSEITYKTQFNNKQASGTTSVQMCGSEGVSTITLMEIAG